MKNYLIILLLLSASGVSIASNAPTPPNEEALKQSQYSKKGGTMIESYGETKFAKELKANGPWFLAALVANYGMNLWDRKSPNHTLNFASAALMSSFLNRFTIFPGLMMGGLESDPNKAHTLNAFTRVDEAITGTTLSKKSIRPLVYGLGTSILTGSALFFLSQEALGENPTKTKLVGSILASLLIPALFVKIDELAEQPDVVADKPNDVAQKAEPIQDGTTVK